MGRTRQPVDENPAKWGGRQLIHTGSTMLNLACSDSRLGGALMGTLMNLVGDRHSGKTLMALTIAAEMAQLKAMSDYRLKHYNVEDGAFFDMQHLFGQKMVSRLEKDSPKTFDAFADMMITDLDKDAGRPGLYILDSFDALGSVEAIAKNKKKREAKSASAKKNVKGSYQLENTRKLTTFLPEVMPRIEETGSLFIIISQIRENLDAFSPVKYRRNGGRALGHWETTEVWVTFTGHINKTVKGISRQVGSRVRGKVKKTRLTGKSREADFDIFPDYGIDDIGSMVDFLVETKVWSKPTEQTIDAVSFKFKGKRDTIIAKIEEEKRVEELSVLVETKWNQIEDSFKSGRAPRFS